MLGAPTRFCLEHFDGWTRRCALVVPLRVSSACWPPAQRAKTRDQRVPPALPDCRRALASRWVLLLHAPCIGSDLSPIKFEVVARSIRRQPHAKRCRKLCSDVVAGPASGTNSRFVQATAGVGLHTEPCINPTHLERKHIMNEANDVLCPCNPCAGSDCSCGCQKPAQQSVCACGPQCRCGGQCACTES